MRQRTWYGLVLVVGVVASSAGRGQAPSAPAATVRELATIEGMVNAYPVLLPSGRTLIYTSLGDGATLNSPRAGDSTFAYDIATKRQTALGTNMLTESVSPRGDRLAFSRTSEDGTGRFVWTMPIDPQTGLATGAAQRVSLRPKNGVSAKFSPDGKMLAFYAGPRPDGTWDLAIVPATGGPERLVANYVSGGSHAWSADGTALYVSNANSSGAIERVPVGGGRAELVARTTLANVNRVGLSPDARVALFQRNPDRFFYRTSSGVEGEISAAMPTPIDWGSGRDMTLEALRYTAMTHAYNQRVRVLDLATGQARDVLPGSVPSSAPVWSPDGRRLAMLTGSRSHYDITIVNADGSSPRHYPIPIHIDAWNYIWQEPWSPDGRFLAFRSNAAPDTRQKVAYGADDRGQLAILDVNSGSIRVLTTASAPIAFGKLRWRSDGSGLRAMKRAEAPSATTPSHYSVVEIPLNGPERQLRDITGEFPGADAPFLLVSDHAVIATVTRAGATERFFLPLDGGRARRLPGPDGPPGTRAGSSVMADHLVLNGLFDQRDEARTVKVVSTMDGSARSLSVPFNARNGVLHPDGKHLIVVGQVTGDFQWKFFHVPLDGSPSRLLGEIPRGTGDFVSLSPDGTQLAYTADGVYTTKILEIDFAPALQTIMRR